MRPPWAAVVGDPVARSLSPEIFRIFSEELGRPLRYRALRLPPERLGRALEARGSSWIGWNVTLPLKIAIFEHLDRVDPVAEDVGAVNVVRFSETEGAIGYNTDVAGFLAPISRRKIVLHGAHVVVLGAGGAARAVCEALKRMEVGQILVLNRTPERAKDLAGRFGCRAGSLTSEAVAEAVSGAEMVVNATSVGFAGDGAHRAANAHPEGRECGAPVRGRRSPGWTPLLPEGVRFKEGAWAYDLVYRPPETAFLAGAREAGAMTIGGLDMLVAQAVETWRIWFGEDVPAGLTDRIENELGRRIA